MATASVVRALQLCPRCASDSPFTRERFSSLLSARRNRSPSDNESPARRLASAKDGSRFGGKAVFGREDWSRKGRRCVKIAASAQKSSAGQQVTDHLVYFKVKEGTPEADADTMVEKLRGLANVGLDGVLEVHCGKALDLLSYAGEEHFTHALHVRCRDHAALHSYAESPEHVDVLEKFVRPIVEAICAVDWDVTLQSQAVDVGIGAVHSVVFKLKENITAEQEAAIIEGSMAQEGTIPTVRQISAGRGFEPNRAQGFTHAFIGRFASIDDLENFGADERHKVLISKEVFPFVEKFALVQFSPS